MILVTSSSELGCGRPGAQIRVGLVAILLAVSACWEPASNPPPTESGGPRAGNTAAGGQKLAPREAHPSQETALPSSPDARSSQQSGTATDPARLLKTEATRLASVELVSCPSGKVQATMPPAMLRQLRQALSRAELAQDAALTPPPWEALLALRFEDGRTVFGQLVRSDILRLRWEPQCTGTRAPELRLGEEAIFLSGWIQEHLGPTQEKAYQAPKGLPPLPGR